MHPKTCPRCGGKISNIKARRRGGRVYYYAVHYLGYERAGGRIVKNTRECYLGPGVYDYVTRLHGREGLSLRGLVDEERALAYLDALIRAVPRLKLDTATRRRLARGFRRLAEELEREE